MAQLRRLYAHRQLRTIERITRPNRDTLHYEATIDDPGAYQPAMDDRVGHPLGGGPELAEYICQENNQFLIDLKDDFGNRVLRGRPSEQLSAQPR